MGTTAAQEGFSTPEADVAYGWPCCSLWMAREAYGWPMELMDWLLLGILGANGAYANGSQWGQWQASVACGWASCSLWMAKAAYG